ncbi:MAG: AraC family transcriptional regulator [Pseudomonadota bacterium]
MPGLIALTASLPAGGGPFELGAVTLGVFLNDQPRHRFACGTSRSDILPLARHEGWILPKGATGICEFDSPLEFLSISLTEDILREAGATRHTDFRPHVGAFDPLLLNLSLAAEGFSASGTLYRETMHRAIAAQLLQTIAPPADWQRDIEDARLRRVLDYIHDNLAKDLRLSDMADLAAMSGTHFSKAFKAATGEAPLRYVINARLDLASVLLRTTELTVAEIAYRSGYNDLSRFGQHFKRKFAAAPATFRAASA